MRARVWLLSLAPISLLAGCFSEAPIIDAGGCADGSAGCECYANGSCDEGLVCGTTDVCVPAGCDAGREGCMCDERGGCVPPFTCLGGVCQSTGSDSSSSTTTGDTTSRGSLEGGDPSTTDSTSTSTSSVVDDSDDSGEGVTSSGPISGDSDDSSSTTGGETSTTDATTAGTGSTTIDPSGGTSTTTGTTAGTSSTTDATTGPEPSFCDMEALANHDTPQDQCDACMQCADADAACENEAFFCDFVVAEAQCSNLIACFEYNILDIITQTCPCPAMGMDAVLAADDLLECRAAACPNACAGFPVTGQTCG